MQIWEVSYIIRIITMLKNENIISEAPFFSIESIWFWIALSEFIIIMILILILYLRLKKYSKPDKTSINNLKKYRKTDINMTELMDDINKSKDLYKELSQVCHPDRFINTEKHKLANSIFQEITKNRRNYKNLCLIKDRMIKELNI